MIPFRHISAALLVSAAFCAIGEETKPLEAAAAAQPVAEPAVEPAAEVAEAPNSAEPEAASEEEETGGETAADEVGIDRYQPILDRLPFGPLPPGFDPNAPMNAGGKNKREAKQLDAESRRLMGAVRICAFNVTPEGRVFVGFVDNSSKPEKSYYLESGKGADGWMVVETDPTTKEATLSKDEIEITLSLGGNNNPAGGNSAATGAAAVAAGRGRSMLGSSTAAPVSGSGSTAVSYLRERRAKREAELKQQEETRKAALAKAKEDAAAAESERKAQREQAEAEREAQKAELQSIRDEMRAEREEARRRREQEAANNNGINPIGEEVQQ